MAATALWALAGVVPSSIRPAAAATRYLDPMFVVDVQRDLSYGSAVTVDGQRVTLTLDLDLPRAMLRRPALFSFVPRVGFLPGHKERW